MEDLFGSEFLKKLEYLYVVSKRLFRGHWKGERRSVQRGTSVEFKDYRNYIVGDDLRHLDWNIFKRLGKLLIKLYEEEEEHYIYILLDASRSMDFGRPNKLLYGKKVVAALSYVGLANQDRVCLATFRDEVVGILPPLRGKGQIFNVFEFLRRVEGGGGTAINGSLKEFVHRIHRRGIVIVVSDFLDGGGYEEGLKHFLYRRFETYLLHILDEGELHPSDLEGDLRLVDSETGQVKEVSITPELLMDYSAAVLEYCREVEDFARRHNMIYIRASTSLDFEGLILKVFRAGGLLK